jgi:hypothetical protein
MSKTESKKRLMIDEIFTKYRELDPRSNVLTVNNDTMKELSTKHAFRNLFDATKFNTYESMPESLRRDGSFIVHLGRGNHAFVRGIGYHYFEPIQQTKNWVVSPSIVSNLGNSEAGTASTLYNDKIIHDFLFGNTAADLLIHSSRRSVTSHDFWIGINQLHADRLQIEMDALFESKDTIATIEVKNIKHTNFEIRQLYSTFRYLDRFKRDGAIPDNYSIRNLFAVVNKGRNEFYRLFEYTFTDWRRMDSIQLVKNAQYNATKTRTLV